MALAVLGLGSSIERDYHLTRALNALCALAAPRPLRRSRVFESPPVGFEDSRHFLNLVVAFETSLSPAELKGRCRVIERDNGRAETASGPTARTLDIDLLLLGDTRMETSEITLPREDILRYAFVLHPLSELLPAQRHPTLGTSYAKLWAEFDARAQPHWPVGFVWRDADAGLDTPSPSRRDDLHNP